MREKEKGKGERSENGEKESEALYRLPFLFSYCSLL